MPQQAFNHKHHIKDNYNLELICAESISVETMVPHCIPLDIPIDKTQLLADWFELFKKLGSSYLSMVESLRLDFVEKYAQLGTVIEPIAWDMNLTHYPELRGTDRWKKFRGTVEWIADEGGDPKRANTLLQELQGTYIEKLFTQIFNHHALKYDREFFGQINITWVGRGQRYNLHNDSNIHLRYHIPIITHLDAFWIFQDTVELEKFYKMHMPFGSVWCLNAGDVIHTVINNWHSPRAHILLTEFI